jgi:chromosome segregation ATPase
MNRTLLSVVLASLFVSPMLLGCGSSVVTLTADEYGRLPRDYRLELFDAENDLVIAKNHQDEAEDHRADAEKALDELAQKWKRANQRLSSSGQGAKVSGARHVYDANVAYLESQVAVASAAIRKGEVEVRVRRAHLDLVVQRQAARIGRAQVSTIKPLEDRVADLEKSLKAATAAEVDLRTKVQAQLNAWKVAEDQYASSANDYDTGVWEP